MDNNTGGEGHPILMFSLLHTSPDAVVVEVPPVAVAGECAAVVVDARDTAPPAVAAAAAVASCWARARDSIAFRGRSYGIETSISACRTGLACAERPLLIEPENILSDTSPAPSDALPLAL